MKPVTFLFVQQAAPAPYAPLTATGSATVTVAPAQ